MKKIKKGRRRLGLLWWGNLLVADQVQAVHCAGFIVSRAGSRFCHKQACSRLLKSWVSCYFKSCLSLLTSHVKPCRSYYFKCYCSYYIKSLSLINSYVFSLTVSYFVLIASNSFPYCFKSYPLLFKILSSVSFLISLRYFISCLPYFKCSLPYYFKSCLLLYFKFYFPYYYSFCINWSSNIN